MNKEETKSPGKHYIYKYDDRNGNREEITNEYPLKGFHREKSEYEDILDEELVDVVYHNDDIYRLFWNRHLLETKEDMKKIVEAEQVLGLIYINDYKHPMVVKSEPLNDRKAGFVGYRKDGKAIIAGEATLYEDHIEVHSSPVYSGVKFNCLCGAEKKQNRPPKAAPQQ